MVQLQLHMKFKLPFKCLVVCSWASLLPNAKVCALSLGKLVQEEGYAFVHLPNERPYLQRDDGPRIYCRESDHVPTIYAHAADGEESSEGMSDSDSSSETDSEGTDSSDSSEEEESDYEQQCSSHSETTSDNSDAEQIENKADPPIMPSSPAIIREELVVKGGTVREAQSIPAEH